MGWLSWLGLARGGGYEAAERTNEQRAKQAERRSLAIDEDRHIGAARPRLTLEARDQDRNNGLLFGTLNRIADYSVPSAIPAFHTSSPAWNAAALRWFKSWARRERCDIRRLRSFDDLVWLAVRQSYIDGDGGFILLRDGRVQMVEGELIATPDPKPHGKNIVQGVEMDGFGAPVAYWICPRNDSGHPDRSKAVRVDAADFVFFRQFTRVDSVRGVSPVAPILNDLIDQKDLHSSYLAKARHDTKDAAVVTTEDGYMPNIPANGSGGDYDNPPPRPASMEDTHLRQYFLRVGENVHQIQPSTPSASIVDYEKNLVRFMSAGLGIPAELVMLDLTGLSWSTANATVKMAGDTFRRVHEWAEESVIRPLIDWRLVMAVQRGELPPPPVDADGFTELFAYRIPVPEYLWADEEAHLKAIKAKYQMGLPAEKILADETGRTVTEILDERQAYIADVYQRCAELERLTGKAVSPLQFMNAETSGIQSIPSAVMSPEPADHNGGTNAR